MSIVELPPLTSEGTEVPRAQNQILTKSSVSSIAYLGVIHYYRAIQSMWATNHPPPLLLNVGPKLRASVKDTPHPALPFTAVSQSDWRAVPVSVREAGIEQSGVVWSVLCNRCQ